MRFPFAHQWALTCLLSLLLLLPPSGRPAWGQHIAPEDFRFEHLTVDRGLSHSDAMAVAQDPAGFIWVGTNRGLDRYDGYQLKKYLLPINPLNGISANRIKVLHVAPNGRLWVGTERAGLSLYDAAADRLLNFDQSQVPARFRPLMRALSQVSVSALTSDRAGRLWVGTYQQGLFRLTFNARGQLTDLQRAQAPAGDQLQVNSLAVDTDGSLWVGTYNLGLCVIRPGTARPLAATTTLAQPIRTLLLDRRGDLWVGTDQRVFWVPPAGRRAGQPLQAQAQPLSYPQLQALLLDSFGRLWVGTIYGLYVWEPAPVTGTAPPLRPGPTRLLPEDGEPFGINSERVHQVFEDRNQIVWLCASAGGLNKVDLRQKPFGRLRRQLTDQASLPNNYVNALYKEEGRNVLWFGTRNGVSGYDLTRKTYRNYLNKEVAGNTIGVDVAAIFQATTGQLWFGTRGAGLHRLARTGSGEALTSYTQPPLNAANVESIAEDRFGTLWLATYGEGLLRVSQDGRLLGSYRTGSSAVPSDYLTYLLYDRNQDVLWASTADAGLLKLRVTPDSVQRLRQFKRPAGSAGRTGLAVNYVWPLLLDRQGTLWIGTIGGGLHRLTTDAQGREVVESYRQYLPESDVESLLADDEGHLWIGGTGLYRFTPGTRQHLRYDVADGLQSNAFKVGAAARAQDGTLYFGGINGISYFQPRAIQPNPYPPVVQITGLRIANQPVAVGKALNGRVVLTRPLSEPQEVTIKASENDFSVEFVGLNYANPQKNRYAYRLRGYNKEWVQPPPGQRTASFANLPAGRYTFEVKASNGEGVWSRRPAVMQFDVRAPWYRTWWAYVLYAVAAVGGVLLYRRVEMRQQALQNRLALEQFQKEKEKEVTDLKLGFFTNVSHELRTPLTLILGPMEEIIDSPGPVPGLRDKLQLMHRQARKLLTLVNELLDFRKVETGHVPLRAAPTDAVALLTDLYGMFRLKAQEREVSYELDVPAPPVPLYVDRGKLEIILTNLLANAFKYTRTRGRVQLAATVIGNPGGEAVYTGGQLTGNYLKVNVTDTGVGIQAHELDRIFDPYYQAAHTDTLRMTGTGIGLALAKQFAERHGGTLAVASTVGVGTSFELRLPFGRQHLAPADLADEPAEAAAAAQLIEPAVADAEHVDDLAAPGEAAATPAPTGPPRLLVVEDNDEVRQYLQQLFAPDYQVLTAEDGVIGWEQALGQLPDLIISDVMMPRSDGLELCQRIKQHPKTAHIPVLLLTARTAEMHELEGLGTGADDYVSKPFNPAILQAKAETMLRNRRKLHEFYQRQILLEPTEIVVADADREFLENAMAVVEKNLDNPEFSVQVLVREVGMSQSVFYRRIKSITGQTVVEFIRDVRMKRAAQLLAHTQLRVSEVAFQVGIEDAKYFRKTFQKIYNVSPSEYAKQHRAGRDNAAAAEE